MSYPLQYTQPIAANIVGATGTAPGAPATMTSGTLQAVSLPAGQVLVADTIALVLNVSAGATAVTLRASFKAWVEVAGVPVVQLDMIPTWLSAQNPSYIEVRCTASLPQSVPFLASNEPLIRITSIPGQPTDSVNITTVANVSDLAGNFLALSGVVYQQGEPNSPWI